MMDPHTIARILRGEVLAGGQVSFSPPGHRSARDRSASLKADPHAPDGILVNTFSPADDRHAVKAWVLDQLGIRPGESRRSRASDPAARAAAKAARAKQRRDERADEGRRTANAIRLWDAGRPLTQGDPAFRYLLRRHVPPVGNALRFAPSCPFAGQFVPTLLALVTDITTRAPRAVHRTALTDDGHKAEVAGHSRLSLGPLRGGAVRLHEDPESDVLGVGEGIESTLSLHRVPEFGQAPVWSLLAANGLKALPVIDGVATLWIAADHDPAGLDAAKACATRWRKAGRTVRLIVPDQPRTDLNDLIRTQGATA